MGWRGVGERHRRRHISSRAFANVTAAATYRPAFALFLARKLALFGVCGENAGFPRFCLEFALVSRARGHFWFRRVTLFSGFSLSGEKSVRPVTFFSGFTLEGAKCRVFLGFYFERGKVFRRVTFFLGFYFGGGRMSRFSRVLL